MGYRPAAGGWGGTQGASWGLCGQLGSSWGQGRAASAVVRAVRVSSFPGGLGGQGARGRADSTSQSVFLGGRCQGSWLQDCPFHLY